MWQRYQRTIAVAACIGGITALAISGIIASLPHRPDSTVQQLVHEVNNLKQGAKATNQQLNEVKTKIDPTIPQKKEATSFMIDGRGYLVTNAHVLNGVSSILVQNQKGENFKAKILFVNPLQDLAILKIDDSDFVPVGALPYGIRKAGADLGEPVFTLGYPREDIVYNQGYLSARTGNNGDTASCQITISANPGNSGGPVLNNNGEVIGILSTKERTADGEVFALKSKNIFAALDSLRRDTANDYPSIHLNTVSSIKNLDRPTQIKKIQDFVYMVKGY